MSTRIARDSAAPAEAAYKRDEDGQIVELIPAMRAFARTFYKDSGEADDLVQETLTRALANFHQYQSGTRLKSWLFTIMRNSFYTRIKKSRRELPGAAECVSTMPRVDASQEWSSRGREIREAIERLPDQQREILVLVGVLGVSYEEAATICDCAIGTIKSRMNRARQNLLTALGEGSARASIERTEHHPVDSLTAAKQ